MGALADLYKKKMSSVNNYFPAQQSVRPYGNSPMQTQSSMAMPDMGAAKSRTSQSLGALLPLLGMGLMLGKHEGMDMGRAMGSVANGVSNNLNRQSALEVWKANQINSQQQAQREQAMARIQANRERMDKIFEMDENLYLDPQANAAYQTGDWNGFAQHLADIKWSKPKEQDRTKLVWKNIGGKMVGLDPYTGEQVTTAGHAGDYDSPQKPTRPTTMTVVLEDNKPHKVAYDPYNPGDKSKWQDLGLAASAVDPLADYLMGINGDSRGGGLATPAEATEGTEEESMTVTEEQAQEMYREEGQAVETFQQFKKELSESGIIVQ